MRFLAIFIIGLLSLFYLSAAIKQILKINLPSLLGLVLIVLGFVTPVLGQNLIGSPLDALVAFFLIGAGLGIIIHHLLAENYILAKNAEKRFLTEHEDKVERLLEIIPGALMWLALTSPIWLSFSLPFAVAYLIILADVYWLFNSVKISVLVIIGYRKAEYAKKQNWLEKLKSDFPDFEKYYHLVLLPTASEGIEILAPSFDAVANSVFPKEKIFLAVGFEERAAEKNPDKIPAAEKYLDDIRKKIHVLTTIHPKNLPGEVVGPGTNRNWMVNNALKEFEKQGIDPKNVLVTTLDCDFVVHEQFLAGALYKYLSTPANERDKRSYTGVFFYYNNYWQAPAPMRLIASGTSFWQLSEQVGSDKYINYASLSINMQSLLDIGLWFPDKVNDDSGFYWRAYYQFKGDYKVIPHYLPIYGDTVLDISLPKTFQNQYLQLKRWAYGVEHIPFIIKNYFSRDDVDFWNKTDKLIFILWSYMKWGALALFISFGGLLIPVFNHSFATSVVAHNESVISSYLLTAAFVGLFSTIFVHEKTVPKRPKNWGFLTRIWSYLQWALIPIILVTIATIPAIDAQTTLMLGRYLEFRTTVKARVTQK